VEYGGGQTAPVSFSRTAAALPIPSASMTASAPVARGSSAPTAAAISRRDTPFFVSLPPYSVPTGFKKAALAKLRFNLESDSRQDAGVASVVRGTAKKCPRKQP